MTEGTRTFASQHSLLSYVASQTGLVFDEQRLSSFESGVRRAMQRAGVSDLTEFQHQVETDIKVFDDLVGELTVGETYFFRDPGQFQYIRETILPAIARERGDDHVIRIWSAGCASGEEAYSLAIQCEQAGLSRRTHILATDLSRVALTKARQGIYRDWSLRGEMSALARKYLREDRQQFVLEDGIRRMVDFDYLNLALDSYPSFATRTWGLDLVLCRNVLIYFQPDVVRQVARRLYECLSPGGWLLLGASDPSLRGFAAWEFDVTEVGTVYRRPAKRFPADLPAGATQDERRFRGDVGLGTGPPGTLPQPATSPSIFDDDDEETVRLDLPGISTAIRRADAILSRAEAASRGGDQNADETAEDPREDLAACVLRVRMLANRDSRQAEQFCAEAVQRHELSVELHFLHSVLLLELQQYRAAAGAARRVLFLDRSLAIAHFTLGTIMQRLGDADEARRAFRNAREICRARPAGEVIALSDGEHAGRLALVAEQHLALI